jgi:hypothetical protein
VSDYYPVSEVVPTTKYAQTTPAKTVVGMNEIGFFLIDPRLNKEKMVDSKSYFYSGDSKPLLSYVPPSSPLFSLIPITVIFLLILAVIPWSSRTKGVDKRDNVI